MAMHEGEGGGKGKETTIQMPEWNFIPGDDIVIIIIVNNNYVIYKF